MVLQIDLKGLIILVTNEKELDKGDCIIWIYKILLVQAEFPQM